VTRPPSDPTTTSTTGTATRRAHRFQDTLGRVVDRLDDPGHRSIVRVGAGLAAAALVVTLGVLVWSGRTTARSADAFCARIDDTRDLGDVLATGDADDIGRAVEQLVAAGRVAPAEVQPAMDQYVDYVKGLGDAVRSSGQDEASMADALQAAVVAQNDRADQVAAAVSDVDAYVGRTCGFTLAPTGSPGSSEPASDSSN
jgi:hypothetical protein